MASEAVASALAGRDVVHFESHGLGGVAPVVVFVGAAVTARVVIPFDGSAARRSPVVLATPLVLAPVAAPAALSARQGGAAAVTHTLLAFVRQVRAGRVVTEVVVVAHASPSRSIVTRTGPNRRSSVRQSV